MKTINTIKTSLIDTILTIENQEFLEALQTIVNSSSAEKPYTFTDSQREILVMSEEDVKYSRLTPHDQVDEEDLAELNKPTDGSY